MTVAAIDAQNAGSIQTYSLRAEVNYPPTIDSTPTETTTAGKPYRYDVHATDDNGDTLELHPRQRAGRE